MNYAQEQLLKARAYTDAGRYELALDCARRAIDALESLAAQADDELTDAEMTAE